MKKFDERIYKNPRSWNLTNDIIFKMVFGRDTERARAMLIDLCNAVLLPMDGDKIVGVEYLNPFNIETYIGDKQSVVDIKARTENGEYINVEMQVKREPFYFARALYYWGEIFTGQLKKKEQYDTLSRTIGIHFLDFDLFDASISAHSKHKLFDVEKGKASSELLEIHFVQMAQIHAIMKAGEKDLAEWITFMKEINNPDKRALLEDYAKQKEVMQMAAEDYAKVTSEDLMRDMIESRQRWVYDYNTGMSVAKKEGIEEGIERVALQLLDILDDQTISDKTGLSIEVVASLRQGVQDKS